jgi:hypothetical protein
VSKPDNTASYLVTPTVLDRFVRALVNEVDYDIHKGYECGEEDGLDHYPELVAEAAKLLDAITSGQADAEFPATQQGGHALIVEYGDEELHGTCQCGKQLRTITPDKPIDQLATPWESHVMRLPTT